jgi:8-oxo-dGTP pyrophosphatase MutT (NUDIX family)
MSERWKPNVTVAALIERDGHYLLVEEQSRDGLRLNNPAGHLEAGESPEQAVVREVLEETGRVFTPEALVGVYLARSRRPADDGGPDHDVTYLRFAYSGTVGEADPALPLDHGIVRTLWMAGDAILACPQLHRSPLLVRGLLDHRAGRRHPLDMVWADPTVFG